MVAYERRQQILQLLDENDFVSTENLVRLIPEASESTIRRDLKLLEDEGMIMLKRGGAAKMRDMTMPDTKIEAKMGLHMEAKEQIARYAAGLVKEGEVIYLDSGSTPLRMVPYLRDKDITIVTTNVLIFQELAGSKVECIVIGGYVNVEMGSVVGDMTVASLEKMFFDRAFIGITGISPKSGYSTPDLKESRKKQVVKENARHAYILADSSKFDMTSMCKVFNLDEVTLIVEQDNGIPKECTKYYIAR